MRLLTPAACSKGQQRFCTLQILQPRPATLELLHHPYCLSMLSILQPQSADLGFLHCFGPDPTAPISRAQLCNLASTLAGSQQPANPDLSHCPCSLGEPSLKPSWPG